MPSWLGQGHLYFTVRTNPRNFMVAAATGDDDNHGDGGGGGGDKFQNV